MCDSWWNDEKATWNFDGIPLHNFSVQLQYELNYQHNSVDSVDETIQSGFFSSFFRFFLRYFRSVWYSNPHIPNYLTKITSIYRFMFFYKICCATTTTVAKMIDRTNYFQLNYPNDNLIALEMMSKQQTQPSSSSMFKKQGLQESGFRLPSNTFFEKNI